MTFLEKFNASLEYIEGNLAGEIDIKKAIGMENESNFKEVPVFWRESFKDGSFDKLCDAAGTQIKKDGFVRMNIGAIMCYEETGKGTFPYMIGAFYKEDSNTRDYKIVEVPGLEWAVFATEPYVSNDEVEEGPEYVPAL